MSPRDHYALMWRVQFYGAGLAVIGLGIFVLGALAGEYSVFRWMLLRAGLLFPYGLQVFADAIVWGTVAIVGIMIPRIVFRYCIAARCPKCGGAAPLRVTSPVRYICDQCGFCAATGNWEESA